MYIAVVKWTVENRVSKHQDFDTQAEAESFIAELLTFPLAFVAPHPGGGPRDWIVDPVAKTLALSVDTVARCAELAPVLAEKARHEFTRRASLAHGIEPRDQLGKMARTLRLIRKEAKGNASQAQIDQLDADDVAQETVEALKDKLDILLDLINDEEDPAELAAIDPTKDSYWI